MLALTLLTAGCGEDGEGAEWVKYDRERAEELIAAIFESTREYQPEDDAEREECVKALAQFGPAALDLIKKKLEEAMKAHQELRMESLRFNRVDLRRAIQMRKEADARFKPIVRSLKEAICEISIAERERQPKTPENNRANAQEDTRAIRAAILAFNMDYAVLPRDLLESMLDEKLVPFTDEHFATFRGKDGSFNVSGENYLGCVPSVNDPWGNRYSILMGSDDEGRETATVISAGPDGKAKTADDIVAGSD